MNEGPKEVEKEVVEEVEKEVRVRGSEIGIDARVFKHLG